jgi:hypothetical protein
MAGDDAVVVGRTRPGAVRSARIAHQARRRAVRIPFADTPSVYPAVFAALHGRPEWIAVFSRTSLRDGRILPRRAPRGCSRADGSSAAVSRAAEDFHHKDARVDGHLFITVLAYQFVQILRRRLQDHGIQGNWNTLRQWLSSQVRVTAVFRRPDGHALHVRKATRPEGQHLAICRALGIDTQPGGIEKLVY